MRQSAGILLWRENRKVLEVMLVHPGGPFWVKKDLGAWSVPKGEFTEEEDPLQAARREFEEETGVQLPQSGFRALSPVRQKSGKVVLAWALGQSVDVTNMHSNEFEMEWPPGSGIHAKFPEVDKADWFDISTAKKKINSGQLPLIMELEKMLTR